MQSKAWSSGELKKKIVSDVNEAIESGDIAVGEEPVLYQHNITIWSTDNTLKVYVYFTWYDDNPNQYNVTSFKEMINTKKILYFTGVIGSCVKNEETKYITEIQFISSAFRFAIKTNLFDNLSSQFDLVYSKAYIRDVVNKLI